jgi:hypothetical protein
METDNQNKLKYLYPSIIAGLFLIASVLIPIYINTTNKLKSVEKIETYKPDGTRYVKERTDYK